MKRNGILITALVLLSIVSGMLLSRASLVGKAGMTLMYREYNFLKTWWKGALLVFILLLVLYIIQGMIQRNKTVRQKKTVNYVAIAVAILGWYFTWFDFTNTVSHRLLGTAFHTGAYLFWIGWISVSVFYLFGLRTMDNNISTNINRSRHERS